MTLVGCFTSLHLTKGTHEVRPETKDKCTKGPDEPEAGHGTRAHDL